MPENKEERPIDLLEIRREIDSLNQQLIEVVAKRMALIPGVARYKIENNLERFDPKREKQILEACRAMATEQGVNPDLAENIMKLLIDDAHRIEREMLGK